MKKCVAIVSGGMDSVTLLTKLIIEGWEVLCMNFSYGSKHNKKERECLLEACTKLNVPVFLYDLPTTGEYIAGVSHSEADLLSSNLLKSGDDVPEGHYEEPIMKQTVVPFRNGIMLSIAVGYAESHGASKVFIGSHFGDHAVYPDCRTVFTMNFSKAAELGTYEGIQVLAPFSKMTKAQIADLGIRMNAPLELTWSCYRGQDRPCLKCSTCIERTEAFYLNNLKDPSLNEEEWEKAVEYMNEAF